MSTINLYRSGNLLIAENWDQIKDLVGPRLGYIHRQWFQGNDLRKRQAQKRNNPSSIAVPHFEDTYRLMYSVKDNTMYCPSGLMSRVVHALEHNNVSYEFEDVRHKENLLPPADFSKLSAFEDLEFRNKQDEILAIIDSCQGGVFDAPTGFGKTFLACMLSVIYPKSRIMFIIPGKSAMNSLFKRLHAVVPGQVGMIGGGRYEPMKRVLVVSADSIHRSPIKKMQLIVYDEVHTAATEKRSTLLTSQYTDAKFIGFTASANVRSDNADFMVEAIFGPVLMRIPYNTAVDSNSVVPIEVQMIRVDRSIISPILDGDSTSKKRHGYWRNDQRNQVIARACENIPNWSGIEDPQILVMCETVEHLFELRRFMPDYQLVYADISTQLYRKLKRRNLLEGHKILTNQQRDHLLKEFEAGRLKKVIANHCWKQAIDPVHLNAFVRADGGSSAINNIQMPGRLSRVSESKEKGLLVDFNDVWDKWAHRRSLKRIKDYEELGLDILTQELVV